MFFYVFDTHTKCIINDFAPAPRTNILIFQCHTVTHGTDLRKSPQSSGDAGKEIWLDALKFVKNHCVSAKMQGKA